ncbi:MAG: HD domain-containing protein, partial [Oscillospiraceae bacterium]|nr:HD domain-containing protein [Oscillospiraceae bacterium]
MDWTVLRIAKGVFYRNAAKSKAWQKKQEREEQTEFDNKELKPIEDNSPKKIDINSIPEFKREIDAFRTERWKTFGYYVFEKVCPLQFFVMPASMSKRFHSICEHSMGKINGDKVERLGGKAFHTIRVVEFLKKIMETDFSEVVTRKGTTYVYGNDYTDEEKDIQILAALCHDIYSGGEGDEFDTTRKSLDINHPYYHEKIFKRPDNIPENEWNLFIQAIRNHMWKWAPQKPVT